MNVDVQELVSLRAGETGIKIPATINGRPQPKWTWTYEGASETEQKNAHTLPVDAEVNRHLGYLSTATDR